jgi:hypothetical protein
MTTTEHTPNAWHDRLHESEFPYRPLCSKCRAVVRWSSLVEAWVHDGFEAEHDAVHPSEAQTTERG